MQPGLCLQVMPADSVPEKPLGDLQDSWMEFRYCLTPAEQLATAFLKDIGTEKAQMHINVIGWP